MSDLPVDGPTTTPAGLPGPEGAGTRPVPRNLWTIVIAGAIVAVCLLAAWMAADAWIHPPGSP